MYAFIVRSSSPVICTLVSLILTVSADNMCGGLENRYICDISDPQIFHICLNGNKHQMHCPGVLQFNAKSQVCDWPSSGLCPYDGYAGLDEKSEEVESDTTDFYDATTYEEDENLQVIEPKSTSPPVTRTPYQWQRNYKRDNNYDNDRYYPFDVQSYGNVHEDAQVKSRDRVFQSYPKPSLYRFKQPSRAAAKRYRPNRPYRSNTWASQRRVRNRFVKPGESFSPYSPPVDAYAYHMIPKQTNTRLSRRQAEPSSRTRESASRPNSDKEWWRQRINSNAAAVHSYNNDVINIRDRSPAAITANVVRPKLERSQIKAVPFWVESHFQKGRNSNQQQTDNTGRDGGIHTLNRPTSKRDNYKGKVQIRSNHWSKSMGMTRRPGTYPKQNLNTQKPSSVIPFQSSSSKDKVGNAGTSFRASNYDANSNTLANEVMPKPKRWPSSKKSQQRVFHSKNLNKRIYPYRPGRAPTSASYSNKFAMVQRKQGSKPSRVKSYLRSMAKHSTKPGKCSSTWCKLPSCRCVGSDIPGQLDRRETPMMVMLTFDDSVNNINFDYYRKIFNGSLRNPNGCQVKGTFFVSGDSTEYGMVQALSKHGHEIASHTLSHRNPTTWWASASADQWQQEVIGMKDRLAHKAGVPRETIQGMRAPFLQIGGDTQYSMLHQNKMRYDSSMVTGDLHKNSKAPIWPFTLDTAPDSQTCNLTPCPKRSYPGLWEVPLVRWYGSNNFACAMPDACTIGSGTKGTLTFLEDNFNRHYQSNKAPLGIFIHASWFKRKSGNLEGLLLFLRSLAQREDVWIVSVSQMLDWVQTPTSLDSVASIPSWQC